MEDLKEWLDDNKWKVIVCVIILVIMGVSSFFLYNNYIDKEVKEEEIVGVTPITKDDIKEVTSKDVAMVVNYTVDIKGQIKNPGVYTLSEGSRVSDAIKAAGGLNGNADTSVTALSKKIKDEMVIIIYSKDEVKNFVKVKEEETKKVEECKCQNEVNNDSCVDKDPSTDKNDDDDSKETTGKISINTATLQQLMILPGIGESKANAIIKYRQDNGLFKEIEDLKKVSGIGDSTYNALKDLIEV